MNSEQLSEYAQSQAERFWRDAGNHWLNDRLELSANDTVIEIGGYLGNWTDYVSSRYECFVDVYEPVKEYYERIVKRLSSRPKVRVFNAAVEAMDGHLHIAVMGEGSSLYDGGLLEGPLVPVVDIDRIVREMGEVDLLAINGEGCEYNVLDRLLATGEMVRVKKLLVQFHVKHPDADERRAAIREGLSSTHSEGICYPFCWESWRRK
jgi:FkbM family methyltransferase